MKFIQTAVGEINVDRIIRATKRALRIGDTGPDATIWYQEGDEVRSTTTYLRDDLEVCTNPVVPASPGFFVVQVIGPAPFTLERTPVIGWRINRCHAIPVTAGLDRTQDSNEWGILYPDGRVEDVEINTYQNEGAFLREVAERLQSCQVPA